MGTGSFDPMADLVMATPRGLSCAAGDFHIDPWQPVARAIITHAHGDHLRSGSGSYLVAAEGEMLVRQRLPPDAEVHAVPYGRPVDFGPVRVSLHPAGHILGSAQVRIEHAGQTWVVTGDYKRAADPTCAPFEVVRCDVLVSEATFALPIYRWEEPRVVAQDIHAWWQRNRERGIASLLHAYALGKAQRVLAELLAFSDQPVFVHGAVAAVTDVYRAAGIAMLPTLPATVPQARAYAGALVLAPPSAAGSPWIRRFGEHDSGFCSGWMRVRGDRRRRGHDRGFVLSDHADWPALLRTVEETGARRVLLTHGHSDTLVRYLGEQGIDAAALATGNGAEE
jgi:putative mRNA 3-end processing factor